ncbi:MAG: hypothetical protein COV66_13070 [Nitrospinae bacterium CG11_big_fil_rev_8_21_14_0_20_45_15]|nr:MAG: hypothetical protein COV66_13070 [Nitrospinae bacterium CG11_big_fil_rev_8_21_14_0_20_45_15]
MKTSPVLLNSRPIVFLIIFAVLFFCSIPRLYAEEITLSAEVDKNRLTLEDSIYLKITAHGAQNTPQPQLPPLPDFRVRTGGTSSSTQIINGSISTRSTHSFILTPTKAGTFTLGPATMKVDGKLYKTKPIQINVTPATAESKAEAPAYVEAHVSKTNPYIGEQVLYIFKFFRKTGVQNLNLDTPYDQLKFRKETLGKTQNYDQNIDGVVWKVLELPIAYIPMQEGAAEIPPAILEMDLLYRSNRAPSRRSPMDDIFDNPFFQSRAQIQHKVLQTRAFNLNVRPLPKTGKPENFSGLVGNIQLSAELGKAELEVGDTTTLTLAITGTGNIDQANLELKDISENFKIYADQPVFEQTIQNQKMGGRKTFKFALVPLKPGKLLIPPVFLSYFDPSKERYKTIQTQPIYLTSKPAKEIQEASKESMKDFSAQTESRENNVKILGEDIFPIHLNADDFEDQSISGRDKMGSLVLIILPVLLFIIAGKHSNHLRRRKLDPDYFKRQGAYKQARQRLDQITSIETSKLFVSELSHILREYIGNKYQFTGATLTSKEAENLLENASIESDIKLATCRLLERFEALQFSPGTDISKESLLEESVKLLDEMERKK